MKLGLKTKVPDAVPETSLQATALRLRRTVLEMCYENGGHISTSFSCVEILTALYFGVLRIDPTNPKMPERDRFILSKGHGESILYAVLAECGFFPQEWLISRYRKGDCLLGGHVNHHVPGVEVTTGALGHGLSIGCGMALAAQRAKQDWRCFVLLGDAECSEGSVWEAALFAAKHRLDNLVAIVDYNRIGSLDFTCNYLALEPFAEKWSAFGWAVDRVDGHDIAALQNCIGSTRGKGVGRPRMIVADTVKGKGAAVFENDPIWHVRAVTDDIIEEARAALSGKDKS